MLLDKFFIGYQPCAGSNAPNPKMPLAFTNPRTNAYIKKFKDLNWDEYLTYDEVQSYSNYGGKMAEGYVVIDIDNPHESNILLNIVKTLQIKTFVVKTTKGMHFYFKMPTDLCYTSRQKIKTLLRIGIEGDFLFGRERFIVLKLDGVERKHLIEEDPEGLPFWLYPIPKSETVKRFSEVHKGERDNSLLAYQVALANQGLNSAEIKQVIQIIGKMVLPEPISDEDVERLTRPEALEGAKTISEGNTQKSLDPTIKKFLKFKKNGDIKIMYDDYAKYLINKLHIIKLNGQLYVYQNGIYMRNSHRNYISYYVANYEIPNLPTKDHNEILKALERNILEDSETPPPSLIPFKNGYVDILEDTGYCDLELHPFTPELHFTYCLPHNYNPNAPLDFIDKVLLEYANGDVKIKAILEEIVGMCIYGSSKIGIKPKCFILTGSRNNGKSTYLDLLKIALGKENYATTAPQLFAERFYSATLYGKLANIVADLNEKKIQDAGLFKEIVSGDSIGGEFKNEAHFTFEPFCTCVFSCNAIPHIVDDSRGTRKRVRIIPFDREFSEVEADPHMITKLKQKENVEAFLLLGLRGLLRVLDNNGDVTKSEKVELRTNDFCNESSPIQGFIEEYTADGSTFVGKVNREVFESYQMYCSGYGIQATNLINFSRKLCELEGLKTVRKKQACICVQVFERGSKYSR